MKAFENLLEEKRERIINAAMRVFANHGYKKSSVSSIAEEAGISKAMVFTYFGSKYGCYEYLCNEMLRVSIAEFEKVKGKLLAVTDYFERVILSATIKIDILKHYPALLMFASSIYKEQDCEVKEIIGQVFSKGYAIREMFLTVGIESEKFRNPDDAKRVSKMADWLSKGCIDEWSHCDIEKLDALLTDYIDCMRALKKHFYKEEFV